MKRGTKKYTEWKIAVGKALRLEIEKRYGERKEYLFAKKMGIGQGSLSDICNGVSSPSAWTLKRLDELGFDIKKLLRTK